MPEIRDIDYKVSLARVRQQNSDLEQCLCIYCEEIIVAPLRLPCDHGSCRSCFLKNNFKKPITETTCLRCNTHLSSTTDIKACNLLQKLIDTLKVKCDQGTLFIYVSHVTVFPVPNCIPFTDYFLKTFNLPHGFQLPPPPCPKKTTMLHPVISNHTNAGVQVREMRDTYFCV